MPCSAEGGGGLERTEQVLEERVRDKKKWAEKKGKECSLMIMIITSVCGMRMHRNGEQRYTLCLRDCRLPPDILPIQKVQPD